MAQQQGVARTRPHIYISSSIANFRDRIKKRYALTEVTNASIWHPWKSGNTVVFFGMYHKHDYLRFLFCRSRRVVFWCGSDILALNGFWNKLISGAKADHICENEVEQVVLLAKGINSDVQPMFFGDPEEFPISYKAKYNPNVFINAHHGRIDEYGINFVLEVASKVLDVTFHIYGISNPQTQKNVIYHGNISEIQFNKEIKNYQAALRLNEFDGFGDVLAKSVLLGQWPISVIKYPHITHAPDMESLIHALRKLKTKTKPNLRGREYWYNEFTKPLYL